MPKQLEQFAKEFNEHLGEDGRKLVTLVKVERLSRDDGPDCWEFFYKLAYAEIPHVVGVLGDAENIPQLAASMAREWAAAAPNNARVQEKIREWEAAGRPLRFTEWKPTEEVCIPLTAKDVTELLAKLYIVNTGLVEALNLSVDLQKAMKLPYGVGQSADINKALNALSDVIGWLRSHPSRLSGRKARQDAPA
jgi:hypothetical protein